MSRGKSSDRGKPDPISEVNQRLQRIERHVRLVDEDLTMLASAVRNNVRVDEEDDGTDGDQSPAPKDVIWSCERCGQKLALYDPQDDVLRIRHRDLLVHVHTATGGWVRSVCRGCGHINEIHNDAPVDVEEQNDL